HEVRMLDEIRAYDLVFEHRPRNLHRVGIEAVECKRRHGAEGFIRDRHQAAERRGEPSLHGSIPKLVKQRSERINRIEAGGVHVIRRRPELGYADDLWWPVHMSSPSAEWVPELVHETAEPALYRFPHYFG